VRAGETGTRCAAQNSAWFAAEVMTPETALLTATAVHFGFQTTVTALVYPV